MNNVIKRDGAEVPFNADKIRIAITKAYNDLPEDKRALDNLHEPDKLIALWTDEIVRKCAAIPHAISVEDIQDIVEDTLMAQGAHHIARSYIRYRYKRELHRKGNAIDNTILGIVNYCNEEVKQENSNKNPSILPTQRDYIAGEVSKDITRRILLPKEIMDAHDAGIIHFHDADYFIQKSTNCCLVNLDDMLQNGTVISGTLIEKPHTFSTACNVATQIVSQVASSQYGFPM